MARLTCPECEGEDYRVVEDVQPEVVLVECLVCGHYYDRQKSPPPGESTHIDDW